MNLILEELEQSGFILATKNFGKQKKEIRFRLIDEYSLFYLKWNQKAKEHNLRSNDINKPYDKELREKKSIFLAQTESKKSIFVTLISPYGVNHQAGYFETIDTTLTMDSLFSS